MQNLFTRPVAVPLTAIFANQTVITMGAYSLSVVIPVAAGDLDIAPESVGFLVAIVYVTAMIVGLQTGGLLARFGPARLFQGLLVLVGAGAVVLTAGSIWAAVLGAVLIGCSSGPMNPVGSYVLARVAPPDIRALVFSLKQCGTPMGGMLAGTILPPLMIAYDWRLAMLTLPLFAAILLVLTPAGALGGHRPTAPGDRTALTESLHALRLIMFDPAIRAVTLTGFGLAVCQMGLATYLVVYLWRSLGHTPEQAGLVFAVLHVAGIASRIVLGVIADRFLATRRVLILIGFVLSAVLLVIANLTSAWPLPLVYLVMVVAGATGNGWVGLYFAELARLAPAGRVAEVAAGSQFVTYLGIVCGPLLFGALLHATDSYSVCFSVLAVLSLACGLYLAAAGRFT